MNNMKIKIEAAIPFFSFAKKNNRRIDRLEKRRKKTDEEKMYVAKHIHGTMQKKSQQKNG